MTGILMTSQSTAGMEGCFRTGCRGFLLCHGSAVGMLSPAQKAEKCLHTSKGQLEMAFIKGFSGAQRDAFSFPEDGIKLDFKTNSFVIKFFY